MMFLGIIVGIIIGLILKGKFGNLAELKFKAFYLILVALLVQVIIISTPLSKTSIIIQFGSVIYVTSIVVLLIGLSLNWSLGWGFRLLIAGAALNFFVVTANLGAIPVDLNKLSIVNQESVAQLEQEFSAHTEFNYRRPIDNNTVFNWLGDILYIPLPILDGNVYSYGDVFIALGLCWFTATTLKGSIKNNLNVEANSTIYG